MKPRQYQSAAVDATLAFFEKNTGNPLVVMPTGSGKSIVVALFIKRVFEIYGKQPILVLTHVKELIEQNYAKLRAVAPEIDAGINSASIGRRDTEHDVLFAGIQSIYKKGLDLKPFKVVLIDECHLVSRKQESMYGKFLTDQKMQNPKLRVVGLTATHYRLDSGLLTEGDKRIFTDVAYEVTIDEIMPEYLAPLISKKNLEQADFSGVRTRMGEYVDNDVAAAFEPVLDRVLDEVQALGALRTHWLVFVPTVDMAHDVAAKLRARIGTAEAIDGSMKKDQREAIIDGYKFGLTRCLVSVGVLTTGFDAPETDLIVLLFRTKSPGKLVQVCGRGMRQAPNKKDCLVLDYGGNIERHGAINKIRPKITRSTSGKAETQINGGATHDCPECGTTTSVFDKTCPECGYKWPLIEIDLTETASNAEIIEKNSKPPIPIVVTDWHFARHSKEGKPDSIKVSYFDKAGYLCSEWVCINHGGFAQKKAQEWLIEHIANPEDLQDFIDQGFFESVDAALQLFDKHHIDYWKRPYILNCRKAKYWEIISREFKAA